ncbi:MAG: glycosyltransferase family 2 protein [Desulfovibrio sp.]|uniref:glycosyltransferase n=1 Tax=Desulfovibrio sp. TaxID=885 RepID=UPI0039E61249
MIGLVVPVFVNKYILSCVKSICKNTHTQEIQICIVNDGRRELDGWLAKHAWPSNVHILNLPENRCFAGANNAGWEFLLQNFPDVKYLGTINDDTNVCPGCIDALIACLEQSPDVGMVGPIQTIPHFFKKTSLAVWRLGDAKEQNMVLVDNDVMQNTYCSVLAGVCLVARAELLRDINFFDSRYINSCEDIDISLSARKAGWRLMVASKARLLHYAGKSRYRKEASSQITTSELTLKRKWGENLSIYNKLDFFS